MSVTTVAKFVTTIAHAIFAFKRYPTSLDFTLIAIQIITKYPFLKGNTGNGHEYLVEMFHNCFKKVS
jgi:hypothetical protein